MRIISLFLTVIICISLAACNKLPDNINTGSQSGNEQEYTYQYDNFNAINGSYVIRQGENIFFTNESGKNLYKMNLDGSKRTKLYSGNCYCLYYLDGYIYFLESDIGISRIHPDGTDYETLYPGHFCWMAVYKDKVYFVDGYYELNEGIGSFQLCAVNSDGSKYTVITDKSVYSVNFTENLIYFHSAEDNCLYSCGYDGSSLALVLTFTDDMGFLACYVYGDNLYFAGVGGIFSISLSTGKVLKLVSSDSYSILVKGDSLYFDTNAGSSDSTYCKADLQGNNIETIINKNGFIISPLFVGDYIYAIGSAGVKCIDPVKKYSEDLNSTRHKKTVVSGDYLFFINEEDDCLYRANKDGTNVVKAVDAKVDKVYASAGQIAYIGYASGYSEKSENDTFGAYVIDSELRKAKYFDESARDPIAYADGYIYYSDGGWTGIFKTGLDGTKYGCLPASKQINDLGIGDWMTVNGGWLYDSFTKYNDNGQATDAGGIYKMDTQGNGYEMLSDQHGSNLIIDDNWLYYINASDFAVNRMRTDGTNPEKVNHSYTNEFLVLNGVLYYASNNELYRCKLDGTGDELLLASKVSSLCTDGKYLYFTNEYDHGNICRIDPNGKKVKVLITSVSDAVNHTSYSIEGVSDLKAPPAPPVAEYNSDDYLTFEDKEFEKFLCTMFGKEPGSIKGSDLLSVIFFGYYEGDPSNDGKLASLDKNASLRNNMVYFSIEPIGPNVYTGSIIFPEAAGDTLKYQKNCSKLTVISNDWMSEHVLPYLYYFKNMNRYLFGYCWLPDNLALPEGSDGTYVNVHPRLTE